MQLSAVPNHRSPSTKTGPIARWYLPVMALIGIGFGLSNYYLKPNRHTQIQTQMAEEKRLQRNRELMDAYGDRDDLKDVERALAVYEVQ